MFQFVSRNYKIFVSDPELKQTETGKKEDQQGKKQIRANQRERTQVKMKKWGTVGGIVLLQLFRTQSC